MADCQYRFTSTIELFEFIAAPVEAFWGVIFKATYGMLWIVSFFDMAFVSGVNVIMERIFESKSEELVGSFVFEGDCSDDGFICSPRVRHKPGSIEESWSNFTNLEIFLNSALLDMPADKLNNFIRLIPNFYLMEPIAIPIVSLGNISAVEVVLDIIVMAKVVGRIDESSSHIYLPIKYI